VFAQDSCYLVQIKACIKQAFIFMRSLLYVFN